MIKGFTSKLVARFRWWLRSRLPAFDNAASVQTYERNGTEDRAFHRVKGFFASATEKTSQPAAEGSKFKPLLSNKDRSCSKNTNHTHIIIVESYASQTQHH